MTNIIVMNKRSTIKKFITLFNRDSGEDMMPDHLWVRWHGLDGQFYNKLWSELDGDNDLYLFDDFCDAGFALTMGDETFLKELSGKRLRKLYKYSKGMLSHYKFVSFFWEVFGFLILKIVQPLFYKVFIPCYIGLSLAWFAWVLFTDTILDFFKEVWRFFTEEN